MANKSYTGDITKHTDWGGDASTGNLPVAGGSVQKFIKDSLEGKIGYVHEDVLNNRCLGFADEENFRLWQQDPEEYADLIISSWRAPVNFTASIDLETPHVNTISADAAGIYVDYTFEITDLSGRIVADSANVTYTFTNGNVVKTVTVSYDSEESIHFNIDKYISKGLNIVNIALIGVTTGAVAQSNVTFNMIDLMFDTHLDISKIYDLTNNQNQLEVEFTISGSGVKNVEWFVDGVAQDYDSEVDYIVETEPINRTRYINISSLLEGAHLLQARAGVVTSEGTFYSESVVHTFYVNCGININPILLFKHTVPASVGIVQDVYTLYGLEEYINTSIKIAGFSPKNRTMEVSVKSIIDGVTTNLSSVSIVNGPANVVEYNFTPLKSGIGTLVFTLDNVDYTFDINVAQSSYGLREITSGLELALDASNKSNYGDRTTWTYGDYSTTFTGFNWNINSGWNNNSLIINAGASISINLSPLNPNPITLGKTLEFEFATKNVSNDDAIIMDLRGNNGVGILITASEASITSSEGKTVSTKFKSNENVRISFVINKVSGSTNQKLVFVYVNGIVSGAMSFTNNANFTSIKNIVISGTEEAEVVLRQIRIYNAALISSQILNNYILYIPTIEELINTFNRNNLYPNNSIIPDPDTASLYLPVMIVTGDISIFDNDHDTDRTIPVDVSYTNKQDATKSFTAKNIVWRLQGTSSLNYPRKNYRFYSAERPDTIMYDYNGNPIPNNLYAFKTEAQPVNCWCLKADFAESSGTHNTGVARLWNKVMYDTIYNGQSALRTNAQQIAKTNNYPYDVRTTVDGFPILLYYRVDDESPLIFVGKYNFNNDKSTESVYGFKNIPGFDNTHVECWEFLDSANSLALFQTVEGWNDIILIDNKPKKRWEGAWETRYPKKNTDTTQLYRLASWIASTNGADPEGNAEAQAKFAEWQANKSNYFDLPKLAAYYIYLIRFGAVDQTVKNAMITTEDGQHWYFINYDNDTILGVDNNGLLRHGPFITRQTIDPDSGAYVYAGHDSVLWNNFEMDPECMSLAKEIDSALYTSGGLTYAKVIEMFNEEQAGKWAETIYNQDAQYKYIGPYVNSGLDYLSRLQGSRSEHRKWWLSTRFNYIDSLNVSGAYKNKIIKFRANAPQDAPITIKSANYGLFGYGLNDYAIESNVELNANEYHTFYLSQAINYGSPVRIYNAQNINTLDLSPWITYIDQEFDVSQAYDPELGTKLKTLKLGASYFTNNSLTTISGLNRMNVLESLDISGYVKITALDALSELYNLKTFKAYRSGLMSAEFADGGLINYVELPSTLDTLVLNNLNYLSTSDLHLEGGYNIKNLTINNCPNILNSTTFVFNWLGNVNRSECSLILSGINWNTTAANAIDFGEKVNELKNFLEADRPESFPLAGVINLDNCDETQANRLVELFGSNVFSSNSIFHINAPESVFINGPSSIVAGEFADYNVIVFSGNKSTEGTITYSISPQTQSYSIQGMAIDSNGRLTTTEYSGFTTQLIKINVLFEGEFIGRASKNIVVTAPTYPSSNIPITFADGNLIIDNTIEARLSTIYNSNSYTGNMTTTWSLDNTISNYVEIKNSATKYCIIGPKENITMPVMLDGTLTAVVTKTNLPLETVSTSTETITVSDGEVILTPTSNPILFIDLQNAGLTIYDDKFTKSEAAAISTADLSRALTYINILQNFIEFQYFTSVTNIPQNLYRFQLRTITFPNSLLSLPDECLASSAHYLKKLDIPNNITYLPNIFAFRNGGGGNNWSNGAYFKRFVRLNKITGCNNLTDVDIRLLYIADNENDRTDQDAIRNHVPIESEKLCAIELTSLDGTYFTIRNLRNGQSISFGTTSYSGDGKNPTPETNYTIASFIVGDPYKITCSSDVIFDENFSQEITGTATSGVSHIEIKAYRCRFYIKCNIAGARFKITYNSNDTLQTEIMNVTINSADVAQAVWIPVNNAIPTYAGGHPINNYLKVEPIDTIIDFKQCTTIKEGGFFAGTTWEFTYDYPSLIGIQHVDGTVYTQQEWVDGGFTAQDANGVAVVRRDHKFCIYGDLYNLSQETISGALSNQYTASTVLDDMDGQTNTTELIALSSTNAIGVSNLQFNNGKSAYIPGFKEVSLIIANSNEINTLRTLIEQSNINSAICSSSQSDSNNSAFFYSNPTYIYASVMNWSTASDYKTLPICEID